MDVIRWYGRGARRLRDARHGAHARTGEAAQSAMRRKSGFPTTATRPDSTPFCALDIFERKKAFRLACWIFRAAWIDEYIRPTGPQSVEQLRPTDTTLTTHEAGGGQCDLSTEEGRTAYNRLRQSIWRKVKADRSRKHIKQLMVSTGFTAKFLLAQIGRS